MTKTEMAEILQNELRSFEQFQDEEDERLFYKHFKEIIDNTIVKLQEQVENSIEYEEQEYDVEDENSEAFGNGIMEGE